MPVDADLKALLEEHLAPLGPVVIKRMFGGGGVFLDGLMFGLVIEGALYLKADDHTRASFEAEGLQPFSYSKKTGTTTVMSYWQAPDRLLDEADEMLAWARDAYGAARRAKAAAKPKPKPNRKAFPG